MEPLLIASHERWQNFYSDEAIELGVTREINFAHTSLTELGADFVTSDF